ncbi:MAG: anion permease [Vulcanimicrobiota bacterium]
MFFSPFYLLGGVFLGWSIGAKDFANVYGTAVTSRMLRFWHAAVLASIGCIIGATIDGWRGIETLSRLAPQSFQTAIIATVAAALAITILNILKLPISTAQAVVGSILGIGMMTHNVRFEGLGKILFCWFIAPIGAALLVIPLYLILGHFYNSLRLNIFQRDSILRWGLIIVGAYASYAMGANNVANVAAVFVGKNMLSVQVASLIGGASIALGILTFSKGVMITIGRGLVKLDAFSALMAVLAEALTVHVFAIIGVPVSTSHAIIGAIVGIGVVRGIKSVKVRSLIGIMVGWFIAPLLSFVIAIMIYFFTHLQYVPAGS